MLLQERVLGKVVDLGNTVEQIVQNKAKFLEYLKQHGVICIKNVDFNPQQQVELTKLLTGEVILLPIEMNFNNRDPIFIQAGRVGNINVDGSLKDSQQDAAYWHQDGDFRQPNDKLIINFLQTKEEPEQDGDTLFLDLIQGYEYLEKNDPQLIEKLRQIVIEVDLYAIPDFKHLDKNQTQIDKIAVHDMVSVCPLNSQKCLFLADSQTFNKTDLKPSDVLPKLIIEKLIHEIGIYQHKWQKGDMLIWDNTQVMHRAQGKFTGRRLLYKTQGKISQIE